MHASLAWSVYARVQDHTNYTCVYMPVHDGAMTCIHVYTLQVPCMHIHGHTRQIGWVCMYVNTCILMNTFQVSVGAPATISMNIHVCTHQEFGHVYMCSSRRQTHTWKYMEIHDVSNVYTREFIFFWGVCFIYSVPMRSPQVPPPLS